MLSQQTGQLGEGITWNEKLQCWQGDDVNLVKSITADRQYTKPVLNSENGYEYLRGNPTEKKQVHHTDKVWCTSWRIVCAGSYFAAGFHGTLGHSDSWNHNDPGNSYSFILKDEGAATHLSFLYHFFTKLAYWRMQPFPSVSGEAVSLAEENKVYIIYLPQGGKASLFLPARIKFTSTWFNPRTGKYSKKKD